MAKKNSTNEHKQVDLVKFLSTADELTKKIEIEKSLVLQKALHSTNIDQIYKAQDYLQKFSKKDSIEQSKTMLIDPMSVNLGLGYHDKNINVSMSMLRNMGKVPIIKAVIETRIEQVCNFAQPQQDKYSTGFVIRPKKIARTGDGEIKLTKEQEEKTNVITEFILNCGVDKVDQYRHDTFENFLRKFVRDSLELDQASLESINTVGGDLFSFQAIDGATIRISEDYFKQLDESYKQSKKDKLINGYLPYYVQIYMNRIHAEYFPWELCLAIRNPQTNIYSNGYGKSELEDLIQTVTNILNADSYNANYFKIGSNPKGIIRVTGNVSQARLEEFRVQWQSQMSGVRNAHKLPIIEAEKMDFISTQTSNKDMEYSRYYEFLIKILCAVYKIDPAEVNFPLSGGSEQKSMFEGNNEARLKHSKDKGLKPLLRFIQSYINKNVISRLDKDYEFIFVGLEIEDQKSELEDDIKKVQNFMKINEMRRKYNLKDLSEEEGGEMILNPMLINMQVQKEMMNQQGGQESNKYMDEEYGEDQEKENPFTKALTNDLEKILNEEVNI